ncbi:Transposon Tf2-6 polyprotein [Senna tora]|uniref:Transposon Tf2-6 polyprotein n=1 Tax=Senna tora TaxID=362788 RepID=A0A834SSJ6_9FABA|nr:Transposon Tf2-6 polyprotein [Senna tora]
MDEAVSILSRSKNHTSRKLIRVEQTPITNYTLQRPSRTRDSKSTHSVLCHPLGPLLGPFTPAFSFHFNHRALILGWFSLHALSLWPGNRLESGNVSFRVIQSSQVASSRAAPSHSTSTCQRMLPFSFCCLWPTMFKGLGVKACGTSGSVAAASFARAHPRLPLYFGLLHNLELPKGCSRTEPDKESCQWRYGEWSCTTAQPMVGIQPTSSAGHAYTPSNIALSIDSQPPSDHLFPGVATVAAVKFDRRAAKWATLVSLSTTTIMAEYPNEFGSETMKSMALSHKFLDFPSHVFPEKQLHNGLLELTTSLQTSSNPLGPSRKSRAPNSSTAGAEPSTPHSPCSTFSALQKSGVYILSRVKDDSVVNLSLRRKLLGFFKYSCEFLQNTQDPIRQGFTVRHFLISYLLKRDRLSYEPHHLSVQQKPHGQFLVVSSLVPTCDSESVRVELSFQRILLLPNQQVVFRLTVVALGVLRITPIAFSPSPFHLNLLSAKDDAPVFPKFDLGTATGPVDVIAAVLLLMHLGHRNSLIQRYCSAPPSLAQPSDHHTVWLQTGISKPPRTNPSLEPVDSGKATYTTRKPDRSCAPMLEPPAGPSELWQP